MVILTMLTILVLIKRKLFLRKVLCSYNIELQLGAGINLGLQDCIECEIISLLTIVEHLPLFNTCFVITSICSFNK